MNRSRDLFWQRIAMELGTLDVALLQNASASFSEGSREYLAVQKKLLREAETDWERQHIGRLVAHHILSFAHFRARNWGEYQRALLRVRRLGYPSLEYRMHAACETLEWAADHDPTKAPLGWMLIEDAERRLRRMRRGHHVRKQALAAIASVKQRVTRKGLTPPTPPSTSKGTPRRRGSRLQSRRIRSTA